MSPSIFIWIVYASWVVLIGYLIFAAIGVKRDTQEHSLQSIGLGLAMVASFLLPYVPVFHFVNFAPLSPVVSSIGLTVYAIGIVFFVWARQTLGRNWSQTVSAKEGHELVTSGPYRYVRNPMYTGGLVAAIGSAIVCGGGWVFLLVILGAIFLWRVGAEDKLMEQQFPNEYPAYRKRTKKLIPFVW